MGKNLISTISALYYSNCLASKTKENKTMQRNKKVWHIDSKRKSIRSIFEETQMLDLQDKDSITYFKDIQRTKENMSKKLKYEKSHTRVSITRQEL